MKLNNFFPTFRQVLFSSEDITKSEGGIYIPDIAQKEKTNTVIKTGSDCLTIKPGDRIVMMDGVIPYRVILDSTVYFLVTEHQIIGYDRTGTTQLRKPKATRNSKLQEG